MTHKKDVKEAIKNLLMTIKKRHRILVYSILHDVTH